MKKSKKLLALLMGATMLTTSLIAGGCGDPNANNPNIINYVEGAVEGRPNYEDETETYKIWSYGQVCADHYYISSEPIYFLDEFGNRVNMQTLERTQELVDCGFTVVFINYSHSGDSMWTTDEEWENSNMKQTLDYCQQLGLKAFSHGSYLYGLGRAVYVEDEYGNRVVSDTRIVPEMVEQKIESYSEELRPKLLQDEKDALIADEEENGTIRAEISQEVRQEILATVTAEADAKTDWESADAKAEWIESETTARFNAQIDSKVTEEINARATEKVDESIEQIALDKYWRADEDMFFRSMEEYATYLAKNVKHLANHPAWYGYSALDEPGYSDFPRVAEGIKAFKMGVEEAYGFTPHVMLNMLPPADSVGVKPAYCAGGASMTLWDAYAQYMEAYKTHFIDTGLLDYFQYDDYPIYNNAVLATYLGSHQMTSEFCKESEVTSVMVMQSYGSDGAHRRNDTEDALWQAHLSAAFGKKEFAYYTYWPILNTTSGLLDDRTHPLTRFGDRTSAWYAIQEANLMLQYFGKYLMNFEFVTSTYSIKAPLPTGVACINGLKKHDDPQDPYYFGKAIVDEEYLTFKGQGGGLLVITELYDEERDQVGFYVVNATDPLVDSEARIKIKFPGFNNVQIVEDGTTTNIALKDNTLKFYLGTGRGAFIMPY